jgi:uncharacterized protein (DUF1684 family)
MSEDELKRLEIERERQTKDEYFGHYADSPIPQEEKHRFSGLKYYPVDANYRFRVQLYPYPSPTVVGMTTSTGTRKQFLRIGFFEFSIDGEMHRLQVYKSAQTNEEELLFIPLHDRTSGVETYGSARYVDIPENEKGVYELDFNKAYNPYCAYDEHYVCPLAPRENWLDVEIRAGEKAYKHP